MLRNVDSSTSDCTPASMSRVTRDRRDVLFIGDIDEEDDPRVAPCAMTADLHDEPDIELPRWLEAAILHALCRQSAWRSAVDAGRACRLVAEAVTEPGGDNDVDLVALFEYLDAAGAPGLAAC